MKTKFRTFFFIITMLLLLLGLTGFDPSSSARAAEQYSTFEPVVTVLESSADRLVLQVALPEMMTTEVEMLDGNIYTSLSVPGAGFTQEGMPDVPVFGEWLLVPNGRTVSLGVDPGEPESVLTDILLSPVQAPQPDLEDSWLPDFVINQETYDTDADFPGVHAELMDTAVMRGQDLSLIRLYPYQYNPVLRELKVYANLTVTITFSGEMEPIAHDLKSEIFEQMYRNLAINADEILEAESLLEVPPTPKFGAYGWDYLIFTDASLEPAAQKLAAWKQKSGYRVLVTKVPTNWSADQLKFAIQDAYEIWDIKPEVVLILGDAEHIPTFYRTWHPYNSTPYKGSKNSQGYAGTDLYYSTLQSKNPFLPDDDLIPEVLLGRISVDDIYQAYDRVDGIIHYEKTPPSNASFYQTVSLAAYFQDGGTAIFYNPNTGKSYTESIPANGIEDRRYSQTVEDAAIFFAKAPQNKTVNRLYYTDLFNPDPKKWNDSKQNKQDWKNFNGPNTTIGATIPAYLWRSKGFKWDADSTDIDTAVNNGTFLIAHRDHGGRTRWSEPAYEYTDVFLLQNANLLPVVWSLNCQTGWFDNETDFKKSGAKDLTGQYDEAFSEYWERPAYAGYYPHDYGAVGVVAPTRVTYGQYNDRLFEGLVNAIWPTYLKPTSKTTPVYQMGAVLNQAKLYMTNYTDTGTKQTLHLEEYHWFGDPSMAIRTQKPSPIAVLHEEPWPWLLKSHLMTVQVGQLLDNGETAPLGGAKVTLSNPDRPNEHWTAITDNEGNASFPDLKIGELSAYDLVATAPNLIPYVGTFQPAAGSAGGIALDAEVYGCDSEIGVRVADIDLQEQEFIQVLLESSAGDSEWVTLSQSPMGSGFFLGEIPSQQGSANPWDGMVQISDSETISAYYHDENDGSENAVLESDHAIIDCQAPIFEGLLSATVEGCTITLDWSPADEDFGLTSYNVYRYHTPGLPSEDPINNTWLFSTTDSVCDFAERTFCYIVRAEDASGNEDVNTVETCIAIE